MLGLKLNHARKRGPGLNKLQIYFKFEAKYMYVLKIMLNLVLNKL